jgi:hypothetical protein
LSIPYHAGRSESPAGIVISISVFFYRLIPSNLMVTAYNLKLKDTPFYETHWIEEPMLPVNPYSVDLETVDRVKNSPQYWQSQQWY